MAVYECTKNVTAKGKPRYLKGERVRTVDGSIHDKRLAASDDWKPVDQPAKQAAKQAEADS